MMKSRISRMTLHGRISALVYVGLLTLLLLDQCLMRVTARSSRGPVYFFFTRGMPVMLLEHLMTPVKLVNGKIGTAVDFVGDPKGRSRLSS